MKHTIAVICTIVFAAVLVVPAVLVAGGQSGVSASKLVANDIVQSGTNGVAASDYSAEEESAEPFDGADYEPGVALVTFSDDVDDYETALAQLSEETGIEGLAIEKVGSGYVEVSIPSEVATEDAIARISTTSVVDDVQPDYIYYIAEDVSSAAITPVASLDLQTGQISLNEQAAINDYDNQSSDRYWHLTKIQAFDAWDQVKAYPGASKDASGVVTVAVLDNCFNVNHEDLVGNIVAAKSVTDAAIGDTSNVGTPYHGTHVAGIVSAQANNGKGAAGVSYNARIMPVRVSNSSGGISTSYLIDAFDYVLANANAYNVRVINVSIGGPRSNLSWSTTDRKLFARIDNAYRAGIVTVVAANNASSSNDLSKKAPFYAFPADYPTCVTVINTTKDDVRYSRNSNGDGSSNFNVSSTQTTKDISAPGTDIYSTGTGTDSSYRTSTGTSMATPVVSGVLALMFAYADAHNQTLTADDAVSRLHSTAVDIGDDGFDAETGYGRVDAYKAVTGATSYLGSANTVKVGATTTLTLGYPATWSSKDPSIATVAKNSGVITGVSPGATVISVRFTIGYLAYTASQTVTVYDPSIMSNGSKISSLNVTYGNTAQLGITDDQPVGNWVWSSADPSIAAVGAGTGVVTAKKPGSTTITVKLSTNEAVSASIPVTVSAIDISKATVTLSASSYTYDGSAKKPSITSVKLGSTTLRSGTDYKVSSYASNTNAGVATVTIIGLGHYAGSVSKAFTINKASISSVTLSPNSYTYDGKAKNPIITVKGSNGKTLSSSDYTLITPSGRTAVGTYTFSVTGKGNYKDTKTASFTIKQSSSGLVQYRTHVQSIGWQSYVKDGATAGTSGRALRLEGINISLGTTGYTGGITYRTHVQSIGWQSWKSNGELSGTSGQALRLEAIQIKLTGSIANYYDVYYRVHCENIGWMSWAKNGESAGSEGYGYRLEAIQVKLVPKGSSVSSASPANAVSQPFAPLVKYRTHVEKDGWQGYVRDGAMAGTSGRALRLEGINISLGTTGLSGSIAYRTHVQNIGWQGWRTDGAMAGTSGQALRLEAIQISLSGDIANSYDVYYRVHCQNFGWMGWAKNGASAGSEGYGYRLEAIQIKLVPKNNSAPGSTANAFRKR